MLYIYILLLGDAENDPFSTNLSWFLLPLSTRQLLKYSFLNHLLLYLLPIHHYFDDCVILFLYK